MLEDWMRAHYFEAEADIGSSGVEDLSVRRLRELTGLPAAALDDVLMRDSPCTGRHDLRAAIAERWGNGDPGWVITTHGGSEAIYTALTTVLEPGDSVIALAPSYHTHTSVARSLGCETVPWVLRPELGFAPELDVLRRLVSPRTRAIVVNFPHNPTGVTLTGGQQRQLIEIAAEADAYLVWDGAFTELTHDGEPLPDPTRIYGKAISVGTFSKAFGLPGMRFGWCSAHPDVIAGMTRLRDRITLSLSPLLELLALHVVGNADKVVGSRLAQVRRNLSVLDSWAHEHRDCVDYCTPAGGVTAFPRLLGHPDTEPLCTALATEDRVLLVPGAAFGHPDRVRLGFGVSPSALDRGLTALSRRLAGSAAVTEKGDSHV
ncbi:capreomycidine synthase [Amycolatopsis sp. H6(2020)]|nr:capreomycidine synthase [Amycolatopsis sp. H6(2020)]